MNELNFILLYYFNRLLVEESFKEGVEQLFWVYNGVDGKTDGLLDLRKRTEYPKNPFALTF